MEKRFRAYLQLKGISQAELSKQSGVQPSTVSRFLLGKAIRSDQLVRLLAACPDLSVDFLFRGQGDMLCQPAPCGDEISGSSVKDDAVVVHGTGGDVNIHVSPGKDSPVPSSLYEVISMRDRIISERDRVISENYQVIREKDEMIKSLLERFHDAYRANEG